MYLSRKDETGTAVDNFEYFYYNKTGSEYSGNSNDVYTQYETMTNKLAYVNDPLGSSGDDLADQSTLNYEYNAIGQLTADNQEQIELIEWTVTGKVKKITRSSGSTKDELEFLYDPMGNRIAKIVKPRTGGNPTNEEDWEVTYYMYDAGGNTMATYNKLIDLDGAEVTEDYMLGEQYIYGSSRIGVVQKNIYVASRISDAETNPGTSTIYNTDGSFYDITAYSSSPAVLSYATAPSTEDLEIIVGRRMYELSNHLGNVLEVLSDKKIAESGDVFHLCFSGTNQHALSATIDAGVAGFDEDMTLAVWVKTDDANGYIAYYYSGADDAGMSINVSSGKASLTGRNGNTYSITALGTTAIDDDQWHYIVGTSDNGIWKIYVDGVLEDTYNGDPGTFSNLDEPFYIGGFTGNYLDGCIKEVSLWNSAKTAVEIDIEFENYLGYSGSETSLKGYWKVNEGSLTNLNDLSSGNHDLTSQNSPTWVSENLVVAYSPDVIQWSDYYPFGMQLPDRYFESANGYRYGFQGQEKDDEIKGEGNSVNYKYRMHDPRIGRFFAVDPMYPEYPYYSPYVFSGNEVIAAVEEEGLQPSDCWTGGSKNKRNRKPAIHVVTFTHIKKPKTFNSAHGRTNRDYSETVRVKKGRTIDIDFVAYGEPDQLIVTDRDGNVIFDQGFIKTDERGIKVTLDHPGKYKVQVVTDKHDGDDTIWDLAIYDEVNATKTTRLYLLWGFIPVKINRRTDYFESEGKVKDGEFRSGWKVKDNGWKQPSKDHRKARREEHQEWRERTRDAQGRGKRRE